ncbi:MAG: AbiH family protein [Saccharofermentanales bacterium]
MKLAILGNGFDLGSGLPTSYKDYFEYYNSTNSEVFTIIEEFLNMEMKTGIEIDFRYQKLSVAYDLRELEISEKLSAYIDPIAPFASDTTISIWNLYFWYSDKSSQQSNKNHNWSDVESQISRLIEDYSTLTFISANQKICNIGENLSEFMKSINYGSPNMHDPYSGEKYSKNIYFKFTKEDRFRFICDFILMKRYGTKCEYDYLTILKLELGLFEENFRAYIANISETYINSKRKNIGIYRDNFFKVTNNKKSSFFILNFNYTDFSSNKKKESVLISRDKKGINVEQMNVHGVYYSKIIFGIDQTDQNQEKFYQFTKTFRKMELHNEIPTTKMPEPQDIDEIIIYGHSLSIADYSYFHSIFDYYEIYGSSIIVNFTYSLFGDESNHENLKNKHVQNIMRLLKFYGDKMFDRERGKNLVHKMLLENRLIIREVTLDSLEK